MNPYGATIGDENRLLSKYGLAMQPATPEGCARLAKRIVAAIRAERELPDQSSRKSTP